VKAASSQYREPKQVSRPHTLRSKLGPEGALKLTEDGFRTLLLIERRRAERSRKPFVLMLVSSAPANGRGAAAFEQVAYVLSSIVRESDLIGWYRNDSVLGVIFTEIGSDVSVPIIETLKSKVLKAFHENLNQSIASKLTLTFHEFPEKWDKEHPYGGADINLYPDICEEISTVQTPRIIKRAIDVAGSAALMVLLAPLLAAIAVAIKLTSRGPVIFKQERLGQFGRPFECLKFRTMCADNDPGIHRNYVQSFIAGKVEGGKGQNGSGVYKITNDPRVTPVGRALRKTSLDELPQLWNVLCGEMSLVGPRPPVGYEFGVYDFWHRRRVLEVKPGITGLWQVSGRSRTCFDDMVRLDLRYSQEWSLWLDLKILLATPLAVFTGDGAF
jgi:lipopolysaccharide/colanic/teichoic acid biosynthesis glycosyltransferase